MRRLLALLLAVALWLGSAPAAPAEESASRLAAFARELRLRDVDGFVETVRSLRTQGRLPARYVTKREAEALGWRPGEDLCRAAQGRTIGGDRFHNRERRLPDSSGRTWREADLDFACGRRGARRLVFSSDGLIFVTLDHYESFREVPR
ncbi:MAG: ribonuclease domain-containing protein [Rhodospirillales bacterium]|jgi:ribonuclease T1